MAVTRGMQFDSNGVAAAVITLGLGADRGVLGHANASGLRKYAFPSG